MPSRFKMRRIKPRLTYRTVVLILTLAGICTLIYACNGSQEWRTASRESAGIAPSPHETQDAIIQVYAADAWSWRGWFAVHTWIAAKPQGANTYTVYEVIGWRQRQGLPVVRIEEDIPDRYWYGEKPRLLQEHRGPDAAHLVKALDAAARTYPWPDEYRVFPGPNSNTFTAWIGREVPELGLDLPFSAIGSGYIARYNGGMSGGDISGF
ncbi:MAG: DUF3750 domain-containing protein [Desulfuromonas sp.]